MTDLDRMEGEYALERVTFANSKDFRDRYQTLARSVPSMVLTSGLGQALAFLLADAKQAPKDVDRNSAPGCLFVDISEWLTKKIGVYSKDKDLMTSILQGTKEQYLAAQDYTLRLLQWLKRLSEAIIPKKEEGSG
ncbi:MAG: type III-B CRISPR module-associated protein Cmr5 [Candidatus Thorarchaeota archaeon]|nr:type III-B CRISPR module-associated protein Cmr5 [Candidatus Thorarchaeota archaeon]